ncbi:hypothetical protein BZG36_03497 [Bifiguratus adelaidae]|uniref:Uncharacterized protein n=1 Tax=Bifiguratus adelaidae TaxID=1938954 RepID=A0A261XZA5_9FUNG|nr:hypothetical protein BZG36_03497 [Bifiguratus adelaidae]
MALTSIQPVIGTTSAGGGTTSKDTLTTTPTSSSSTDKPTTSTTPAPTSTTPTTSSTSSAPPSTTSKPVASTPSPSLARTTSIVTVPPSSLSATGTATISSASSASSSANAAGDGGAGNLEVPLIAPSRDFRGKLETGEPQYASRTKESDTFFLRDLHGGGDRYKEIQDPWAVHSTTASQPSTTPQLSHAQPYGHDYYEYASNPATTPQASSAALPQPYAAGYHPDVYYDATYQPAYPEEAGTWVGEGHPGPAPGYHHY